jgi:hypothetical protein
MRGPDYSSFENFLTTRVISSRVNAKETRWGPFFSKLSTDALTKGPFALRPYTVLNADYCPLARHSIVHHKTPALPRKPGDDVAADWFKRLMKEREYLVYWHASSKKAKTCLDNLINSVHARVVKARKDAKGPSYDFFYTLFALTYLDDLAFEIEGALFDPDQPPVTTIYRHPSKVRNQEMIKAPL